MPNKVDKKTERLILQYVARFPEDGIDASFMNCKMKVCK